MPCVRGGVLTSMSGIGASNERLRCISILRERCDSHARGVRDLVFVDHDRLGDDLQQSLRHPLGIFPGALQKHRELVAAEARHFRSGAHPTGSRDQRTAHQVLAKSVSQTAKQLIASRVAQGVVHLLEAVEVDVQNGEFDAI